MTNALSVLKYLLGKKIKYSVTQCLLVGTNIIELVNFFLKRMRIYFDIRSKKYLYLICTPTSSVFAIRDSV